MDGLIPPPMPILPNGARMSLAARLTNVFSGPGEVFEAIAKGPPSTGNWLAPALLSCVLGIVSTMVIFSQDNVVQQIRDQQAQVLERKLEKLPKEKREQVREMMEKWTSPSLMKLFGSVGTVVRSFGSLFISAGVLWLVGTRLFKGSFSFMQAAEVCGVAAMINILGGIVTMLLVIVMGNTLATAGPALLIREPAPSNPAHLMLSALNVMTFWYL